MSNISRTTARCLAPDPHEYAKKQLAKLKEIQHEEMMMAKAEREKDEKQKKKLEAAAKKLADKKAAEYAEAVKHFPKCQWCGDTIIITQKHGAPKPKYCCEECRHLNYLEQQKKYHRARREKERRG